MKIKNKLEDIVSKHSLFSGFVVCSFYSISLGIIDSYYDKESILHEISEVFSGEPPEIAAHVILPITIGSLVYAGGKLIRTIKGYKESEGRYRAVTESAIDAIISADNKGNIISWNGGAETMFGYELTEVLGRPLTLIIPEQYRDHHINGLERVRSTGEYKVVGTTVELQGLRKDGSEFPLELSLSAWTSGQEEFYTGIIRDISERKIYERRLVDLVQETHHRVKNNLQTIGSLLNLMMREHQENAYVVEALTAGINRVQSMATLHEMLYQSENIEDVRLDSYVGTLVDYLAGTYALSNVIIEKEMKSGIMLNAQKAVSLGLIINELVTNALKYAFPNGSTGDNRITISTQTYNGNEVLLTVGDNGVSLPKDFDPLNTNSLGLKLVYSLAGQLGGSINYEANGGTKFSLTFPNISP